MALMDLAATAEDNLLASDELEELIQEDLKYRDRQLLRLRDEVLDMEDFQEGVTLGDFSLDDFRAELAAFIAQHRKRLEEAPLGLYAVVSGDGAAQPGVIFCLRQQGAAAATAQAVNPLQPHFLVYLLDSGEVRFNFAQAKQVLELFRGLCSGRGQAEKALCEAFDRATGDGADMRRYSELLKRAVEAVLQQFNRKAAAALLESRSGRLPLAGARPQAMDDFELVTWLVISTVRA